MLAKDMKSIPTVSEIAILLLGRNHNTSKTVKLSDGVHAGQLCELRQWN